MDKKLFIVHCIDTEGPLCETINETFKRINETYGLNYESTEENLRKLQNQEMNLGNLNEIIAKHISPDLLNYNSSWLDIDRMLEKISTKDFREHTLDDEGKGWICSWHCVDHLGLIENPRKKDYGYGKIFRHYKSKLKELDCINDEINWHFHPISITGGALHAASSYLNNYNLLIQILCRRILDDNWFPVVNRPGFHTERPDSHLFLEQWIPFDYANQSGAYNDQPDLENNRFGDWNRAPKAGWAIILVMMIIKQKVIATDGFLDV